MERVSTNLANNDAQFYMRKRERALLTVEKKISSQNRITNLRDEPLAASHAVRYQSTSLRIERFSTNVEALQGETRLAEGYVQYSVEILQNSRELAVRLANGSYTTEDRKMAVEQIDQYLEELLNTANKKDGDGNYIFAGTNTDRIPFRAIMGNDGAGTPSRMVGVEYLGNISIQQIEIHESNYAFRNAVGSDVFWAKNDRLISTTNTENYVVPSNTEINVLGENIQLLAGDSVLAIVQKINDAPIPVRASISDLDGGIMLETTTPQQLWLEDSANGSVLRDLGLINDRTAPYNKHPSALYSSGSVFDILITFRESLLEGNVADIGSRVIANIDDALETTLKTMASYGALSDRLDLIYKQLSTDGLRMNELDSQATGVDYARSVTDLNMLKYSHEAALSVSAKVLQNSLLDYLR